MSKYKNTPQTDGTGCEARQNLSKECIEALKLSDGTHKRCNSCNNVIRKADNYCGYCRSPNPK